MSYMYGTLITAVSEQNSIGQCADASLPNSLHRHLI